MQVHPIFHPPTSPLWCYCSLLSCLGNWSLLLTPQFTIAVVCKRCSHSSALWYWSLSHSAFCFPGVSNYSSLFLALFSHYRILAVLKAVSDLIFHPEAFFFLWNLLSLSPVRVVPLLSAAVSSLCSTFSLPSLESWVASGILDLLSFSFLSMVNSYFSPWGDIFRKEVNFQDSYDWKILFISPLNWWTWLVVVSHGKNLFLE